MTGKISNRFFITFIVVVASVLIACGLLTVYIDPFFHYHKPVAWFPYVVDDQVDMNPGLARHMDYDSVLLGSSMTVAFDTSKFGEMMGLSTQKLSYNGAYPKDQSNIMDILFAAKAADTPGRTSSVDRVFLGIDELNYSSDTEQTKYPITEYLYNTSVLDDTSYIFNKTVLLDYILKPMVDREDQSDWNMIYKMWWQPQHYNLANVRLYYTPADEIADTTPVEAYLEGIEKNLSVNIIPYIEAHPDTEFTVFYPPYSILYWYDAKRQSQIDTIVAKYNYMTKRLLEYDNVDVFFFQNREEIICNFDNYADYTHYSPEVCDWMVKCFANGDNQVTLENLDDELSLLEHLAKDYDYDSIDL